MACHIALLLLISVPGRLAIHCYYLPVMSWRVFFSNFVFFFSFHFHWIDTKCHLEFLLSFQFKMFSFPIETTGELIYACKVGLSGETWIFLQV